MKISIIQMDLKWPYTVLILAFWCLFILNYSVVSVEHSIELFAVQKFKQMTFQLTAIHQVSQSYSCIVTINFISMSAFNRHKQNVSIVT